MLVQHGTHTESPETQTSWRPTGRRRAAKTRKECDSLRPCLHPDESEVGVAVGGTSGWPGIGSMGHVYEPDNWGKYFSREASVFR